MSTRVLAVNDVASRIRCTNRPLSTAAVAALHATTPRSFPRVEWGPAIYVNLPSVQPPQSLSLHQHGEAERERERERERMDSKIWRATMVVKQRQNKRAAEGMDVRAWMCT
jgi:hypothetical protein